MGRGMVLTRDKTSVLKRVPRGSSIQRKICKRQSLRQRGFRPEIEILTPVIFELLIECDNVKKTKRQVPAKYQSVNLIFDVAEACFRRRLAEGMDIGAAIDKMRIVQCQICHCELNLKEPIHEHNRDRIAIDQAHIKSLAHGGSNDLSNMFACCRECNKAANDCHMIEYCIKNNLPGLAMFEQTQPEEVAQYRQLIKETNQARAKIQRLIPRGSLSRRTRLLLESGLTAPIELRQRLIRAINNL
jgi:hypothetical protein